MSVGQAGVLVVLMCIVVLLLTFVIVWESCSEKTKEGFKIAFKKAWGDVA